MGEFLHVMPVMELVVVVLVAGEDPAQADRAVVVVPVAAL
jgi:hypothetical protein